MKNAILMLGLAAVLAACASDPQATDAVSEKFEPSPGGGVIYVYRGLDPVVLAGAKIKVADQPVASLHRHDYVRVDVPPGQHLIFCANAETPLAVDVQPGRLVFVEALLRVGWMAPSCALMPLDDPDGRSRIMEGRRIVPQA